MTRKSADPKLFEALVSGRTLTAAAADAGISLATAKRRMVDPTFRGEVEAAQSDVVNSALRTLAASSEAAALTLRNLLSPKTADSIRLAAAKSILEIARGQDIDQRLSKLEQQLSPPPADDESEPTPIRPRNRNSAK